MKKGVIIFLHLGYWLLYCLLLLLINALLMRSSEVGMPMPVGLGVHFAEQGKGLKVMDIIKDGPADKQGELKAGDEILKLILASGDTVNVTDVPTEQARPLIKGEKGTAISMIVMHKDGSRQALTVVRDRFNPDSGPTFKHGLLLMLDCALIPGLIAFYCFYTFLFSKLLSRRRVALFILAGVLIAILTAIPGEILMYFTFIKGTMKWDFGVCFGIGVIISVNALLNGILGLVMRGFISWYGDIKLKEELNKKNYETELALIKSQINPHFLFNTINNIDVLIMKDPEQASGYLNKLSDIMRFMLYETKSEKILLEKELQYIAKYIELQRIRTANPNYISYKVTGDPQALMIEPMLFIPFIENAFKHSENKKIDNGIRIFISIHEEKIHFECENNYAKQLQVEPGYGGLGNDLISRRLALLYPGRHRFEIINSDGLYKVILVLSL